jgi:Flp pilus assembly pilin Flp
VHRLTELLTDGHEDGDHTVDYVVIVLLMAATIVVAFVFFGDAIADLVTLIGGRVDQATLAK